MSKNLKNQIAAHNTTEQVINTLSEQAEQLVADKEIDQALTLLAEAEPLYPDSPQISHLIGKFTADKKNQLEGIKKLEQVLERFPDHLASLVELGHLHLRASNITLANRFFHKALETDPLNPGVYMGMGALNQRKGDLPLAVEHYRKAIELQLKHPITRTEPTEKENFDIANAEKLLWDTLALLTNNGMHVFMAFGSLLGIVRNGELLLHDKDVDVGLPYSEMNRAIQILQKNGWQEIMNSFGYMSPRAVLHKETGFSLDLFGFLIDDQSKKSLCIGAGIPNIPKEWNILWEFDAIQLEKTTTPDGKDRIWSLKNPEAWLERIYGDWRTPDKNFDTMVSAKNLRSFSLLAQCFTYSRVFDNWTKNNVRRALSLTRTALAHEPNDALLKRVLIRLENRRK